jgi:phage regulator Rha-like protein
VTSYQKPVILQNKLNMRIIKSIQNRIYEIRGERVMLDFDLAVLYEVGTKVLNQAVKRHINRFPKDFMFRLTPEEWEDMRSQSKRNSKITPYAFTEQGVAMLSGILNSDKAIAMNNAIMRAFVEIRRVLIQETDLREQLKQIKERICEHDIQLNQLYDAMENLLDEKTGQKKWNDRDRIGFKTKVN